MPQPYERQGEVPIVEARHPNIAGAITVELAVLQPRQEPPVSVIVLSARDQEGFSYVVNALLRGQNGRQNFELSAPSTYFGDNNVTITFYPTGEESPVLVEVACQEERSWISHNFVFRSLARHEDFVVFEKLVERMDFFYIVPGLQGEGDFAHVVVPKYLYRVKRP